MHSLSRRLLAVFTLAVLGAAPLSAQETARATYLANEGVMITSDAGKILFDPLFDNSFGQYQLLPKDMQADLFAGAPPFDNVDAVFVSHAHGDHFSAALMLDYLRAQPTVRLYAPMQAVTALRDAGDAGDRLFNRVTGLDIDVGDDPVNIELAGISVSAVRIPHSGWPNRMTDIENIAFHIVLDDAVGIVHMGDADASIEHFRRHGDYWSQLQTGLALPPYWFFLSAEGRQILDVVVDAGRSVGVHVPVDMPDDPAARPAEIRDYDLFTEPGEVRDFN